MLQDTAQVGGEEFRFSGRPSCQSWLESGLTRGRCGTSDVGDLMVALSLHRRTRGLSSMIDQRRAEVWQRLLSGEPLDGLGLALKNGRLDLSGLVSPQPTIERTLETPHGDVTLGQTWQANGVTWKSLDLSGSRLPWGMLDGCTIKDCVFDGCDCMHWRTWANTFEDTSFRSASLRGAGLGGQDEEGKWNRFYRVDFSDTDLRDTTYGAAEFVGCRFGNNRLRKIRFDGCSFADCTFEGEMKDVLFVNEGLIGKPYPRNEMRGVDFRGAKLRQVDFVKLDLEDVRLPSDPEIIVIEGNYVETIRAVLRAVAGSPDRASLVIEGYFEGLLKWALPNQRRGAVYKETFRKLGGEESVRRLEQLIRSAAANG